MREEKVIVRRRIVNPETEENDSYLAEIHFIYFYGTVELFDNIKKHQLDSGSS